MMSVARIALLCLIVEIGAAADRDLLSNACLRPVLGSLVNTFFDRFLLVPNRIIAVSFVSVASDGCGMFCVVPNGCLALS